MIERDLYPEVFTYGHLVRIASAQLRGKRDLYQLCGPMTTGGLHDREANRMYFCAVMHVLKKQLGEDCIFDQLSFGPTLKRLSQENPPEGGGYNANPLEYFYSHLFQMPGMIGTCIFLPGWQSSEGSRWEHDLAKNLGKNILYLKSDWMEHYQESKTLELIG